MPPLMSNHGNYIVSLGNVTRWLGQQAEALGVDTKGLDLGIGGVNRTESRPIGFGGVIEEVRRMSRDDAERVARDWFAGADAADVFDFPELG